MHMLRKIRIRLAAVCLLSIIMLATGLMGSAADDETQIRSTAPNTGTAVIYHYADPDMTPTLYMWGLTKAATYRVYNETGTDAVLLGTARWQAQGSCCIVPLDPELLDQNGGTVYVSCQVDGEAESERVPIAYPARATPSVGFRVYRPRNTIQSGTEAVSSTYKGTLQNRPSALTAGNYYIVDVTLSNFSQLQSLTLPIKYDPTVLELTALNYQQSLNGYTFGAPVNAADGVFLRQFMIPDTIGSTTIGGNPGYGIGVYPDLRDWGAIQSTANINTYSQSPYVNTDTGLIKLELSAEQGPVDLRTIGGSTSNTRTILRLFFKCIKTPDDTSANWAAAAVDPDSILHFATIADVPDGITDLIEQGKYHSTISPHGYTASIESINLMAPPPSTMSGAIYASNSTMTLTAEQVYDLPQSLSSADQIRTLLENHVKVYNYTNSSGGLGSLDYAANDVLVLTPSAGAAGAARKGDRISVYVPNGTGYQRVGEPVTVDNEGGVVIDLGTDQLLPEGGSVYVTVTRSGTESAKVEIPYQAEMSRDVYFKVNSSGIDGENIPLGSNFTVNAGDQIRMDIYFNHFDDLLAYTFHINFNPRVLQMADKEFHRQVQDGYISEEDLRSGESCLQVGADLTGITANEEIAYQTWQSYKAGSMTEAQVLEITAALGIESLERLEEIADAVEVKYSFGKLNWNGGLLFTGPAREAGTNGSNDPGRDEGSLYPYVDNDLGILRLASASLVNPPLVLSRDGDGYQFLSVYFVAVTGGEARLSVNGVRGSRVNGVETVTSTDGTELVLSGPGTAETTASTVCTMPFTAHWQGYAMEETEKTAVIKLLGGNATEEDNDRTALYLYNGYAFRDPGFTLQAADDTILVDTSVNRVEAQVERYYVVDGVKHTLPVWTDGEALSGEFVIPTGRSSAAYTLVYAYTDELGNTVSAVRKVYVIYMRGDINGDGSIDLFDEQMLQDGTADTADSLYSSKTLVTQDELHNSLMEGAALKQEYIMPVARSPNSLGEGSAENDAFRMWLEFYSADAEPGTSPEPLDPLALPAGQDVISVVRYENLSALSGMGLVNFAVCLDYDPLCFTPKDFTLSMNGDVKLWQENAGVLNSEWVGSTSSLATSVTDADASDRPGVNGRREIYLQYLNIAGELAAFEEESGYLAAFTFTVANKSFSDAELCWLDYAMTLTDGETVTTCNRCQLLDGTRVFQKPADVTTASLFSNGYTITGVVVSYNAKNPITYELYRMGGDGQYETTPAYTGTAVEAVTEGTTAGQHVQDFAITGVGSGTYKLVIQKVSHLNFIVLNVEVNQEDLNLSKYVSSFEMGAGDVNGDGNINAIDSNVVIKSNNFGKLSDAMGVTDPQADINGDGSINALDGNIIILAKYFGKGSTNFTVSIHY